MNSLSQVPQIVLSQFLGWLIFGAFVLLIFRSFKKTRDAWRRFALNRGLTPPDESYLTPLLLSGTHQGHRFTLDVEVRGTGKSKARYTRCLVDISGDLPSCLVVAQEGLFSSLSKVFGAQDLQTENDELDRNATIRGAEPQEVIRYFQNPNTREAALAVIRAGCQSRIENQQVKLYRPGVLNSEEKLQSLLDQAIEAARGLGRS